MCACMCVHVGVRVCGVVLFVHVCGRVLVCVYVCVCVCMCVCLHEHACGCVQAGGN